MREGGVEMLSLILAKQRKLTPTYKIDVLFISSSIDFEREPHLIKHGITFSNLLNEMHILPLPCTFSYNFSSSRFFFLFRNSLFFFPINKLILGYYEKNKLYTYIHTCMC